jgi:hypothetical protein
MTPRSQVPCPDHEEHVPDIRMLTLKERRVLGTGPTVTLYDGNDYIMQLPRKLFLAATTVSRLVDDRSDIRLPLDTGYEAVLSIGCYLLALTTSPKPFKLRNKRDLEADLRILKAARLLRMETYVVHIHNWYWWKLNNRPFSAADVQTVLKVSLGSDDPYVQLVGEKIAGLIRNGTLNQVDKLKAYVDAQPYLKSIVAREDKRYHTIMEYQARKAKRVARRETRSAQFPHGSSENEGYIPGAVERKTKDTSVAHEECARQR